MLEAAKDIAADMYSKRTPRWLTLSGKSGSGKTHLAKQLKRFWNARAGWITLPGKAGNVMSLLECRFISWRLFIERQRAGNYEEMADLRSVPFLIIDDIGADHDPNGFAKSRLDELVDGRIGKWTVITTNLSLEEIHERLDGRIASRMKRGGSRFIETTAMDYNLRK